MRPRPSSDSSAHQTEIDFSNAGRHAGFTLIEILVVIAILVLLASISIPTISSMRQRRAVEETRTLVEAAALAVAAHPERRWVFERSGGGTGAVPVFDCNQDLLLDLDPAADVYTRAAPWPSRAEMAASGYAGFVRMTAFKAPRGAVAADGRVVDAWAQPLRIAWAGIGYPPSLAAELPDRHAQGYGRTGFGIWSIGKDGRPGSPDDILSWSQEH
jgi:prepilin-type N-terminal cleavage/methylation domain-containing protein